MSRDSSGNYTSPSSSFVSGTTISSSVMNGKLDDIGSEITNSLDRSGKGGMLARLRGVDGTSALPAYAFTSETTLGLYRAGSGDLRASSNGTDIQKWSSTAITVYQATTLEKGVVVTNSTANGAGLTSTGNGTGQGVVGTGGSTSGAGLRGVGGAPNGAGTSGQGTGTGQGGIFVGGATGVGVAGTGGSTSGVGGTFTGGPNSSGAVVTGTGTGYGLEGVGGATGFGVQGSGTIGVNGIGTSAEGMVGTGAAGAVGVRGVGGSNAAGVQGTGTGTGKGGTFTGGATGAGVVGTGGSTSGSGGEFAATTSGVGVVAVGAGSGLGASVTSGTAATGGAPQNALEVTNGYYGFGASVTVPDSTTPVARAITPSNIIGARVKFTNSSIGGQPTVVAGFNVTSVLNSGDNVIITWASAFADADYTVTFANNGPGTAPYALAQTSTTLTVATYLTADGSAVDMNNSGGTVHVMAAGIQ